ncbi:phenazine-specific anthranilate synthase component I [Actinoplanes italicus]|uniref:anthranilate synthase n=1 Tax=Actinoplanes italicus TaxID=113567 RepID=A0A2T0K9D3_9ACTN|nr:anthranilate synthase family protein [Actinoplanes italicus]PRX19747.1 phenazine biosynthesis protein phzE [Actinoplanes italicus]GIE31596.1 phenazine-specific anthranilate synthase component I [Actinoplanes italicus]
MPYALLHRDGADHVDVLTGDVVTVGTLDEIPMTPGTPVLAVIGYRQITERGFDCVDDGAPLECLLVRSRHREPLENFPPGDITLRDGGFDLSDDEYGSIVEDVLRDEIGHGEGANFVIHRTYTARFEGDPRAAFGRLLAGEQGTYWTFLVDTGNRILVGATPERHVSVLDGIVMMNPISGTFRNGSGDILDFLRDPKEIEELYMVLDEELKMMATVAEHGGQVAGPYLKEMARLTHTEYLLAGRGSLDVRAVLRETMFAPTVTGSPIENACRVIARHERRGRRYYAGVLALLDHDDSGRQTLDAPILIRTAEITPDGVLRVPVGATLVRHSTAAGEVAETHTKASGLLSALGAVPANPHVVRSDAHSPEVQSLLAARNDELARFWLDSRAPGALTVPSLAGRHAAIVDAEDTFTAMLAHQLKALGLTVTVHSWKSLASSSVPVPGGSPVLPDVLASADLILFGPGPGDPSDLGDPKMATLHRLVTAALAAEHPLFAVCLGQQILASLLGLPLARRDSPYQGLARDVSLFGTNRRVGFYSSFSAVATAPPASSDSAAIAFSATASSATASSGSAITACPGSAAPVSSAVPAPPGSTTGVITAHGPVDLAVDPADGTVHALRGDGFAGVQFHPESVLSRDGVDILRELLPPLLAHMVNPAIPG